MYQKHMISQLILLIISAFLLLFTYIFPHLDPFWGGFGFALLFISLLRLLQIFRLQTNEAYARKITIQNHDERNLFLSNKARSWAYSYSMLLMGILVILLRILHQDELSTAIGLFGCAMLLIYCSCYYYLRRKN